MLPLGESTPGPCAWATCTTTNRTVQRSPSPPSLLRGLLRIWSFSDQLAGLASLLEALGSTAPSRSSDLPPLQQLFDLVPIGGAGGDGRDLSIHVATRRLTTVVNLRQLVRGFKITVIFRPRWGRRRRRGCTSPTPRRRCRPCLTSVRSFRRDQSSATCWCRRCWRRCRRRHSELCHPRPSSNGVVTHSSWLARRLGGRRLRLLLMLLM